MVKDCSLELVFPGFSWKKGNMGYPFTDRLLSAVFLKCSVVYGPVSLRSVLFPAILWCFKKHSPVKSCLLINEQSGFLAVLVCFNRSGSVRSFSFLLAAPLIRPKNFFSVGICTARCGGPFLAVHPMLRWESRGGS